MKQTRADSQNKLAQVAKELHRLADNIGAGQVQVSGVDLTISDSVTLKVKQKMSGEKVVLDLKIQALLAKPETRPKKKSIKMSAVKRRLLKRKKTIKSVGRPYGVKALKKKYTAVWRGIASQIKKGEMPDKTAVLELESLSSEYGDLAPPEWASLWQDCETLVSQCIRAATGGDMDEAQNLLDAIAGAKKGGHKVYK